MESGDWTASFVLKPRRRLHRMVFFTKKQVIDPKHIHVLLYSLVYDENRRWYKVRIRNLGSLRINIPC